MGVWDFMNSSTDVVKRNAPDLSSVRDACWSSYAYSWSTVTKIDNAVRVGVVQRLNQYLPDEEGRAKIGRFATSFAKNAAVYACHEGLKYLPLPGGVSLYNIVTRSLRDEKTEDYKEALKTLQARIGRLERESSHCRELLNKAEMLGCDVQLESRIAPCIDSNANQKPEDVIRIFMMKEEFVGGHVLDGLVVPRAVGQGKNRKYNTTENQE